MSSFCEENIHTFECVAKDYASTGAYYMYCIYICVFKCFSKALFHFRLNKPSESLVLLEPPLEKAEYNTNNMIHLFGQVVLPLVDQYFKNHRLYFLSTAIRPISSGGHASNKEKEMVTRWGVAFL